MKKNDISKKLTVKKTTIASLEVQEMSQVQGGQLDKRYTEWSVCLTEC